MSAEKLIEKIRTVDKGRYDAKYSEMIAIREASTDPVDLFLNAYNFGFIQGQKAAKAEAKREKKQMDERDTSGWYAYLSRWIERNIGHEKLLEAVGTHARRLQDAINKIEAAGTARSEEAANQ